MFIDKFPRNWFSMNVDTFCCLLNECAPLTQLLFYSWCTQWQCNHMLPELLMIKTIEFIILYAVIHRYNSKKKNILCKIKSHHKAWQSQKKRKKSESRLTNMKTKREVTNLPTKTFTPLWHCLLVIYDRDNLLYQRMNMNCVGVSMIKC